MRKKITSVSNDITTNEMTADEITTSELTTNEITANSHFHAGEQAIQTRLGVRESMERFGRQVITNYMPEQHREFYQQLPFILLGHADKDGWPWATMLFNDANFKSSDSELATSAFSTSAFSTSAFSTSGFSTSGFISSSNNKTLTINSKPIAGEPFAELLQQGQQNNSRIGLLGIELSTRRRNRLAGHITEVNNNAIEIEVDQAFGNCPQYIQMRELINIDEQSQGNGQSNEQGKRRDKTEVTSITEFDDKTKAFICNSDTFFVASYVKTNNEHSNDSANTNTNTKSNANINEGVDVSHRGGRPGFIRVDNNRTLTIPDYTGNFHFNTLGNFLLTPKAGLLFPDFETGDLLTLTGHVEILWDSAETEFFEGAERLWQFKIDHGFWMKNALPLRWKLNQYSANTLMTGTWDEAEKFQQAELEKNQWQNYRITKIIDESSVIKSFYLNPVKSQRAQFSAGQFITVKAIINDKEVIRTYTVSSSPHDSGYRISVKRETSNDKESQDGIFSSYLHDKVSVGDTLQIKAATGDFTYDTQSDRATVLIAAGVGITPMVSMARYALHEAIRTRSGRQLTLIHAAHDHRQRAFFEELKEIEKNSSGHIRCFWTLSEINDDLNPGEHYHHHGHINRALLQAVLPLDDYDFYLCGPTGFMQTIYNLLREIGVNDQRIFTESFGPSTLERTNDQATKTFQSSPSAKEAIVEFTRSNVKQAWTEEDGTLLEFAEAHGLSPEYGCRSGQCSSCKVKLLSGKVSYNQTLHTSVDDDEVLLCCAMPARSSDENMAKIKIDL